MKLLPKLLLWSLFATYALAQTNQLSLMWIQPVGYQSTIYQATNLNGQWYFMTNQPPPASILCTQHSAFFIILMAPTNQPTCTAGNGQPTNIAAAGSTYYQMDTGSFWAHDTNTWVPIIY